MKCAFYKASGSIFDKLIHWWEHGTYSHVEVILDELPNGDYICASSEPGVGVRIAELTLKPEEWDIIEGPGNVEKVREWFDAHAGAKYDWLGIVGCVFRPETGNKKRYFCSEAVATAIGLSEPWRWDPNVLADGLRYYQRLSQNPLD